ncbi:MAG: alpha/beta fold hydrolase, partial [Xanthomonadales bacterium]|nr:alpha/beta fold hydrolase [Xanthomonadales bacterium]
MPMRNVLLAVVALTALVGGAGWYVVQKLLPPASVPAVADPAQAELAARFLDLLDARRYDEALAMATPRVQEGLAGGKLAEIWETLPKQLGERKARSAVRGESVNGKPIIAATLSFAMLPLDARITFDSERRIAGFWIVPAKSTSAAAAEPERGEGWHEVATGVGQGADVLPATLTLPESGAPFAAVVLVHGSGAHDRDETIGPNKPFRDLAHGLATRGIAVLRYEKRSKQQPQRYAGAAYTVDDETTNDALAAVAMLRTRADVDPKRVFVAGHSLGALVAPRIGARDPAIAGLILLAGPAAPLADTVVRQSRYLLQQDGKNAAEIDAALAPIEAQRDAVRRIDASTPADAPSLLGLPAAYWRDLAGYDPVATSRTLAQPMLVLQGGRDYQVTVADDFSRWREAFPADPRVQLREYPTLGHTFIP